MSGTIWMYSDRMDDWDILFAQKSFITYREGCDYYDLTEKVMTRLAQEAGAVYKMGTRFVRIRRDVFEEYLREQYRKELADEGETDLPGGNGLYLVKSIKDNGVIVPVLVRPDDEGTYEMISGHRRMHAAKLAGLTTIPAIIKPMTNDEATIAMVDANMQREEILPSERAFSLKMKMMR